MEFEDAKKRLLAEHADDQLTAVGVWFLLVAKKEGRPPNEEELFFMTTIEGVFRAVTGQVEHLSSLLDKPPYQSLLTTNAENLDEGNREVLAARADLVLTNEETFFEDDRRATYVPRGSLTVREAFDYLDRWEGKARAVDNLKWLIETEWAPYKDIAEMVGDEPPNTLGELIDYRERLDADRREEK